MILLFSFSACFNPPPLPRLTLGQLVFARELENCRLQLIQYIPKFICGWLSFAGPDMSAKGPSTNDRLSYSEYGLQRHRANLPEYIDILYTLDIGSLALIYFSFLFKYGAGNCDVPSKIP